MKKLALGVLVTVAGCTTADPSEEILGTTHQAVTTAPAAPTPVPRPAPRRMGAGTGVSGGGTQGGGGASAPGWHPLVNQPQTFFAGTSLLLTDGTVMCKT